MEILIPTLGIFGDIPQVLTLGKALLTRGMRVTVLTNRIFLEQVTQAGLLFQELGEPSTYRSLLSQAGFWQVHKTFQNMAEYLVTPLTEPLFKAISDQYDPEDTLVVACGFCLGARLAQERWGYKTISLYFQPAMIESAYQPTWSGNSRIPEWLPLPLSRSWVKTRERGVYDASLASELNSYRRKLNLPPVKNIFSQWMHSPDGIVACFPDWFAPPQPDWPQNLKLTGFIGHSGPNEILPATLEAFLAEGDAPVCFTTNAPAEFAANFFSESSQVCSSLRCRGLFVTQDENVLPPVLPENIFSIQEVNFRRLMPNLLAIVHPGMMDLVPLALRNAIPQLIVPLVNDQPDNAQRIRDLQVGDWIQPKDYSNRLVAKKLGFLIESREVRKMVEIVASWVNFREALEKTVQEIEKHLPAGK